MSEKLTLKSLAVGEPAADVITTERVLQNVLIDTTVNSGRIPGGVENPEGLVVAPPGSLYLQEGVGLYEKRTGTGSTGWEKLGAGGGGGVDVSDPVPYFNSALV